MYHRISKEISMIINKDITLQEIVSQTEGVLRRITLTSRAILGIGRTIISSYTD